jgi:hypothetical protein
VSKRRKIERPADFTAGPLPEEVAHEQAVASHRDRVLSDEHVRAAFPARQRDGELDRSSYREGSTAQGRRKMGAVSPEERYAVAMEFVPHQPTLDRVRVQRGVVEAVMRVPFVTLALDADLLSRHYAFAIWVSRLTGSYDWRSDLTTERIEEFAAATLNGMSHRTVNTYRSQLMRVKRGDNLPLKSGRKSKALTPIHQSEYDEMWLNGDKCDKWSDEVLTLLALAGGAGLRPNEINYIQSSWVNKSTRGLYIRVPNDHGEFRDVPVFGRYANTIEKAVARTGRNDYLVMPRLVSRRNLVSQLKTNVTPLQSSFANYDTIRVRNLWITRMLAAGVPMVVIAQVAGVKGGSSLLADLASDLPKPELSRVFEYLSLPELTT